MKLIKGVLLALFVLVFMFFFSIATIFMVICVPTSDSFQECIVDVPNLFFY